MLVQQVLVPPGFLGTPQTSGCIYWKNSKGACYYPRHKNKQVSRIVLKTKLCREIKVGCYACHVCDDPTCINPDHLFECSPQENILAMAKGKRNKIPAIRL